MDAGKVLSAVVAATLASAPSWSAPPPQEGGTIYVVSTSTAAEDDEASRAFVAAASAALGAKGFTILSEPGHAAYVAEVSFGREQVGTGRAKVKAGRPAIGGAGVSVPFSSGQYTLVPVLRTRMDVRIHKRNESAAVWHGAALTVRSVAAQDGSDESVAAALSNAAMASYPTEVASIVSVP